MAPDKTFLCGGCNQIVALDQLSAGACPYCGSGELEFLNDTGAANIPWGEVAPPEPEIEREGVDWL